MGHPATAGSAVSRRCRRSTQGATIRERRSGGQAQRRGRGEDHRGGDGAGGRGAHHRRAEQRQVGAGRGEPIRARRGSTPPSGPTTSTMSPSAGTVDVAQRVRAPPRAGRSRTRRRRPAPRRRRSGPAARPRGATPAAPACRPRGPPRPTWPARARPCSPVQRATQRSACQGTITSTPTSVRVSTAVSPALALGQRLDDDDPRLRRRDDLTLAHPGRRARRGRSGPRRLGVQDGSRPVAEVDALADLEPLHRDGVPALGSATASTRSPTPAPRRGGAARSRNSAAVIWRRTRP